VLANTDTNFSRMTKALPPILAFLRNCVVRILLYFAPDGSLPPPSHKGKMFGTGISYSGVGTCVDHGTSPPKDTLVAGDRLPDHNNRVHDSTQSADLHSLLGPLSTEYTLVVVGDPAVGVQATTAVSGIPNLAKRVFFICPEGTPPIPPNKGDGIEVVQLTPEQSQYSKSLMDQLGLKLKGTAILLVRPDTHLAMVHRGPFEATALASNIKAAALM